MYITFASIRSRGLKLAAQEWRRIMHDDLTYCSERTKVWMRLAHAGFIYRG